MLILSSLNADPLQALPASTSSQPATKASDISVSSSQSSLPSLSPSKKSATTTDSSSSSSDVAGVPQSVMTALESYISPTQQAWNALAASLSAGNLSSAQSALTTYMNALSAASGTMAAPSAAFLNDLASLGDSLQAGDWSAAQSAFAAAQTDAPASATQEVSSAEGIADEDGYDAVYAIEHTLEGVETGHIQQVDTEQLTSDISNVDSALRQEGTYLTDALVSMGYTSGTAQIYASAITGISVGDSAQDDSTTDATRATQWIQELIAIGHGSATAAGYSNLQASSTSDSNAVTNEVSNALSSVLFANAIDSGQLLQSLISHTLNGNNAGSVAGASTSAGTGTSSASGDISVYA